MTQAVSRAPRWVIAIATLFGLFLVAVLVGAYTGNLPTSLFDRIPYYDKLGHLVLYCIASGLGHLACGRRHWRRNRWLPVFPTVFFVLMTIEEIVQFFAPNRTLDMADWLCSAAGVVLGYIAAQRIDLRANDKSRLAN